MRRPRCPTGPATRSKPSRSLLPGRRDLGHRTSRDEWVRSGGAAAHGPLLAKTRLIALDRVGFARGSALKPSPAGFDVHLTKPVAANDLHAALEHAGSIQRAGRGPIDRRGAPPRERTPAAAGAARGAGGQGPTARARASSAGSEAPWRKARGRRCSAKSGTITDSRGNHVQRDPWLTMHGARPPTRPPQLTKLTGGATGDRSGAGERQRRPGDRADEENARPRRSRAPSRGCSTRRRNRGERLGRAGDHARGSTARHESRQRPHARRSSASEEPARFGRDSRDDIEPACA